MHYGSKGVECSYRYLPWTVGVFPQSQVSLVPSRNAEIRRLLMYRSKPSYRPLLATQLGPRALEVNV
jgi:hypothetical protein